MEKIKKISSQIFFPQPILIPTPPSLRFFVAAAVLLSSRRYLSPSAHGAPSSYFQWPQCVLFALQRCALLPAPLPWSSLRALPLLRAQLPRLAAVLLQPPSHGVQFSLPSPRPRLPLVFSKPRQQHPVSIFLPIASRSLFTSTRTRSPACRDGTPAACPWRLAKAPPSIVLALVTAASSAADQDRPWRAPSRPCSSPCPCHRFSVTQHPIPARARHARSTAANPCVRPPSTARSWCPSSGPGLCAWPRRWSRTRQTSTLATNLRSPRRRNVSLLHPWLRVYLRRAASL